MGINARKYNELLGLEIAVKGEPNARGTCGAITWQKKCPVWVSRKTKSMKTSDQGGNIVHHVIEELRFRYMNMTRGAAPMSPDEFRFSTCQPSGADEVYLYPASPAIVSDDKREIVVSVIRKAS